MKKIISIISVCLTALYSCDNMLDLEPKTSWSVLNMPSELIHVENILNGGYERIGSALLDGFVIYGDERADVYYVNAANYAVHDRITRSQLDGNLSESNWYRFYQIIRQANINIEYVPQLIADYTITADEGNPILGQAYCQRAFAYFWITRIWGEAPLRLEAVTNTGQDIAIRKSSVDDVFKCIHNDLDSAYKYIPAQTAAARVTRTHFSPIAVKALKAHAYMWQKEYVKAIDELNDVVVSGYYTLSPLYDATQTPANTSAFRSFIATTAYSKMFNSTTGGTGNESIFEVAFSSESRNINNTFDNFWANATNPVFRAREECMHLYTTDDFRYYAHIVPVGQRYNCDKFVKNYARGDNRNLVLIRLADIYLLYAEAVIMLSNEDPTNEQRNAIMSYINKIRVRARGAGAAYLAGNGSDGGYLDRNVFPDKAEFLRLVKLERQKELMFEGQRWFDLVRWDDAKEALANMRESEQYDFNFYNGPVYLSESGLDLVWPVYNEEIRRSNGRIEQNIYYR